MDKDNSPIDVMTKCVNALRLELPENVHDSVVMIWIDCLNYFAKPSEEVDKVSDGWIKAEETKVKVFHRPTETWYWYDIRWGNRHATGNGWLCVLQEGEELKRQAFRGDNRMEIDSSDCDIYLPKWAYKRKEDERVNDADMTVQEFYSGFDLSFLSEQEKQTIYTATELFARGKVRQAKNPDEITDLLVACEEYFEKRVDVDYEGDPLEPVPNEAMKLYSAIKEVLEKSPM